MHDNRAILLKRIERTLEERITPAATRYIKDLEISRFDLGWDDATSGVKEPIPLEQAWNQEYVPSEVGAPFGPAWGTTWWRMGTQIPAELVGKHLELSIDLGWEDHSPGFQSEGLVFAPDKTVIKALNPRNNWVPVDSSQPRVDVVIETGANPLILEPHPFLPTELGDRETSPNVLNYRLSRACLVEVDDVTRELARDLDALAGMIRTLPENDTRAWEILFACNDALDLLDMEDVRAAAAEARKRLAGVLAEPARTNGHTLYAVGHAHIDSAWLWPLRETRRKVTRTLANVCRLIEDGHDMIFALPAAQHVAWLKEENPELFARVQKHVAEGAIAPVGGMWVECDAVMPGGEAFARQLVEGLNFYETELGKTCPEIWLPDSFGYSAAIPQLAHLAGIDRFLTQKISWNQVDKFPHHTMWWEGIDGTRIFTHFPPVDTYGSEVSAEQLNYADHNFKEKGRAQLSLLPYGYGDGGGGPTREMLGRIERFHNIDGMPKIVTGSPQEFFEKAQEEYPEAPVWVGELYLELHRGTFTSQRNIKVGNRRRESLLREAELWAATAAWRTNYQYPEKELQECWQYTMLCQFHDILPGTCIKWVYREVERLDAIVREVCERTIAEALSALSGKSLTGADVRSALIDRAPANKAASQTETKKLVLNAASFDASTGDDVVPALGMAEIDLSQVSPSVESGKEIVLDNGKVKVKFTGGYVTSIIGEQGREVVPPEQRLGELHIHQDFPNMWDAWDIDPFYKNSKKILPEPEIAEIWADNAGQHVATKCAFGSSKVRCVWTLAPGASSLAVRLDIDWHEQEKLLKFAMPVDVHTDKAQFETQFGHITRATHQNTSWDFYRFEVSCHRWLRVAEGDWGVAIANESTYGWDISRHARLGGGTYSVVRASLLKGPLYPDPRTDQGEHTFAFTIRPDASTLDAVAEGQALNLPLRQFTDLQVADNSPILGMTGAVIESVRFDPASGDLLVRAYESQGAIGKAHFKCADASKVCGVDLRYRENDLGVKVRPSEGGWEFDLRPFQIVTLRVSR